MADKIKVGVLMGGRSAEREISYRSGKNLIGSLNREKYEVTEYNIPPDTRGEWISALAADRPDIVLNALHGGRGEDGGVQGVLACLGIPFIGSGVAASALCMDKATCKAVMASGHIPTAEGFLIKRNSEISDLRRDLGFPLIVKPNRGGSSLGISIANNDRELKAAAEKIFKEFNDDALVEQYIEGREVTCAVLQGKGGPEVFSLLDINRKNGIFDYNAKYEAEVWSGGISTLPAYMQDTINGIAKKAFALLGCSGYACVDMLLREEQIYVIEVNTLPGMTEQSLIPNALKAVGKGLGGFISGLIEDKLQRGGAREVKQRVYDKLAKMGIKYEKDDHEAVYTIEQVDSIGAFNKGVGCKNLFLRDEKGKRHFLLVAREHAQVDLKDVRAQIGCSRLSFGSEKRLWDCLKLKGGSVSPFGVLNDTEHKVEVVFDLSLKGEERLGFHPNDNTSTVWLSFEDIRRVVEDNGNEIYFVRVE